jgi:hypothetical protein
VPAPHGHGHTWCCRTARGAPRRQQQRLQHAQRRQPACWRRQQLPATLQRTPARLQRQRQHGQSLEQRRSTPRPVPAGWRRRGWRARGARTWRPARAWRRLGSSRRRCSRQQQRQRQLLAGRQQQAAALVGCSSSRRPGAGAAHRRCGSCPARPAWPHEPRAAGGCGAGACVGLAGAASAVCV